MISLTFDTDHMNEGRMADFLSDVEIPGAGTVYCTQSYDCLLNQRHELAPHPFLNKGLDWLKELKTKRAQFPKAVGWRAHSCVFSHTLAEWLAFNGYVYASTHDSFGQTNLRPTAHLWGIWHVPIYYMDNLDFSRGRFWPEFREKPFSRSLIDQAIASDSLSVFDFHPIHLMLNTPNPDWYADVRGRFISGEPVSKLRFNGYGTRSFYDELVDAMGKSGVRSVSSIDALRHFAGAEVRPRDMTHFSYVQDESRLGF